MKKIILLIFLLFFTGLYSQNKEYQFKFNVRKFRKEFKKNKKQPMQLKICDINDRTLIFNVAESYISENPIKTINTFKGVSVDGTKNHLLY